MHFLGTLTFVLSLSLSQAFPAPVDAVIVQVQQWIVVGTERVEKQVLLNGVSLTGTNQEFNSIIETIFVNGLPGTLTNSNQTSELKNHTVLCSRDCILEGAEWELHWTDRVFYDGKVYLTLSHTGNWTAQVPQATVLKVLWDREVQQTGMDGLRHQEECVKLMRELKLLQKQPVPRSPLSLIWIPVFAVLIFIILILINFFLSKNCGLRHPGGVIGSLIHYPMDMTEVSSEIKGDGYLIL